MTRYTRRDVLRILHLQPNQLNAWEKEGLIPMTGEEGLYTFDHLSRLRALRELRSRRMSARNIRAQVDAMQQRVAGMRNALAETSAVRHGKTLSFRHGGALVDAVTQQLAFDFGVPAEGPARVLLAWGATASAERAQMDAVEVQAKFARAVQLEESAKTVAEAARLYQEILTIKPDHAPACINMGTILYNQREFERAEGMYRRATEADPNYALAYFDLGNVLDEMQRLDEAVAAYTRAIELVPAYADAHYNLALAIERKGMRRRALRHWMAYVRLDPTGPWSAHAQAQVRKILGAERLSIVSRTGRQPASEGAGRSLRRLG